MGKSKISWVLSVVFSGIGCTIITLLCQSPPQVITYIYNGQVVSVSADSYQNTLDQLERLERKIEYLQTVSSSPLPFDAYIAEVWLRNGENIDGCPHIIPPKETKITDSMQYEMKWEPFDDASTYKISIWKDLNYGSSNSNIVPVAEIEVDGLSYTIDLDKLEHGYVYGFNVVAENHYSAPLLVELH